MKLFLLSLILHLHQSSVSSLPIDSKKYNRIFSYRIV